MDKYNIKPTNNFNKLFHLSRELRKSQTESEKIIWNFVRNRNFNNLKFVRQKIFGEFIVDFYCAELNLVLEIDGEIHKFQVERDVLRDKYLNDNFNLKILRIKNKEIKELNEIKLKTFLENKIATL